MRLNIFSAITSHLDHLNRNWACYGNWSGRYCMAVPTKICYVWTANTYPSIKFFCSDHPVDTFPSHWPTKEKLGRNNPQYMLIADLIKLKDLWSLYD